MPTPENKTRIVTLRLKPSELEQLDARAKAVNLSRSAYMTRKLTGLPVMSARVPAVNWKLYGELADISASLPDLGNNIARIARTLKTAKSKGEAIPKSLPQPESLESAIELMETILELLTEVRLTLSGVRQSENIEQISNL